MRKQKVQLIVLALIMVIAVCVVVFIPEDTGDYVEDVIDYQMTPQDLKYIEPETKITESSTLEDSQENN